MIIFWDNGQGYSDHELWFVDTTVIFGDLAKRLAKQASVLYDPAGIDDSTYGFLVGTSQDIEFNESKAEYWEDNHVELLTWVVLFVRQLAQTEAWIELLATRYPLCNYEKLNELGEIEKKRAEIQRLRPKTNCENPDYWKNSGDFALERRSAELAAELLGEEMPE